MHTAYLGLGANLPGAAGAPEATLSAAVLRLGSFGRVAACSSLYSTAPVGFSEQPRFLNAAIALETGLAPLALLRALLEIEREFGRDRSAAIPNGPRTLDLDILLIDELQVTEPELRIPHPRLAARGFALIPLNEIAPGARDPRTGATVAQLLQRLGSASRSDPIGIQNNVPPTSVQINIDSVVLIQSDLWPPRPSGPRPGSQ